MEVEQMKDEVEFVRKAFDDIQNLDRFRLLREFEKRLGSSQHSNTIMPERYCETDEQMSKQAILLDWLVFKDILLKKKNYWELQSHVDSLEVVADAVGLTYKTNEKTEQG